MVGPWTVKASESRSYSIRRTATRRSALARRGSAEVPEAGGEESDEAFKRLRLNAAGLGGGNLAPV